MSSSVFLLALIVSRALHPSLTSNGVVESLLGQLASLVGRVEDLIVENGEVQGKSEADGVGRSKAGGGDLGGSLVGLKRLIGRGLALVANGELGEVTVVVALPVQGKAVSRGYQIRYIGSSYILW